MINAFLYLASMLSTCCVRRHVSHLVKSLRMAPWPFSERQISDRKFVWIDVTVAYLTYPSVSLFHRATVPHSQCLWLCSSHHRPSKPLLSSDMLHSLSGKCHVTLWTYCCTLTSLFTSRYESHLSSCCCLLYRQGQTVVSHFSEIPDLRQLWIPWLGGLGGLPPS